MDPRRLADIRSGDADEQHRLGSGYLIAPRLVLTARHAAVEKSTGVPWPRIDVRVGHPGPDHGARERRAATVCWIHPGGRDVALFLLETPVEVPGAVRWGRPGGTAPLPYEALGFPRAVVKADGRRNVEYMEGTLPPLAGGAAPHDRYVLNQGPSPAWRLAGEQAWGGASGSAVFCHQHLVGVVVHDDDAYENRRLHACPAHAFITDPGFVARLERYGDGPPELADIEADAAPHGSEIVAGKRGSRGQLPLVHEVTDRALLGIHPAIPLPDHPMHGLSAELPSYVTRDIDEKLRETLHSRATGGVFAVIVGSAASGKTRTAYEAIRMVVPTWRLFLPATVEELQSTLDSNVPLTRTVIWLDELQNYLGPGGLDFSTVRRLLIDPDNPVILIGTIWPNFFNKWRSRGQDLVAGWRPGEGSRNVLDMAKRFDLPPHITRAERDRAKILAATDPRIEEALTQERAGNLTEVLAAQPDLLRYWENPDSVYGAAIVASAIDARRCGHRDPIPTVLLEQLAPHYLTDVQRAKAAPDWFPTAMEWACTSVRGTTAPLNPSAKRMGHIDGYHASDLLLQHAWDKRDDGSIPHEVWRLLVDESSGDQCSRIGVAAWNASQIDLADRAFQRALATEEDVDALIGLAGMHHNEGNREVARDWARRAAATGHRAGVAVLGFMLDMHGQSEAAREAFLPAAEAGDPDAMRDLGSLLMRQNDLNGAHPWLRRAAEAGSLEAKRDLGGLEDQRGDMQAALRWLSWAAEEGDVKAMVVLSDRLRQEDPEASASWLARAAAAGHPDAATELGSHKLAEGDHETAQEILRAPAHMGRSLAMLLFGVSYHNQEDYGTALIWFRRAVESGLDGAIAFYGKLLADLGHVDEARIWLKRGIDKKQHAAMHYMAEILRKEGKLTEAARLDRRAASLEREEQGGRVSAASGKGRPKKRRNRRTGPQNPATKNDSSSEQPALGNGSAGEQGIEPIRLSLGRSARRSR